MLVFLSTAAWAGIVPADLGFGANKGLRHRFKQSIVFEGIIIEVLRIWVLVRPLLIAPTYLTMPYLIIVVEIGKAAAPLPARRIGRLLERSEYVFLKKSRGYSAPLLVGEAQ